MDLKEPSTAKFFVSIKETTESGHNALVVIVPKSLKVELVENHRHRDLTPNRSKLDGPGERKIVL